MPTKNQLQEENKKLKEEVELAGGVYTDFKNMKDERDGLKVRWKELQEENNVFAEEKTNMCVLLSQTIRENEKLKEENELKKDAWCPELILTDLYENTNYKDPSITIKEYIQKIEAENEELKKQIPDKKGKKLSKKDKEVLYDISIAWEMADGPGPDVEEEKKLLKRLLK